MLKLVTFSIKDRKGHSEPPADLAFDARVLPHPVLLLPLDAEHAEPSPSVEGPSDRPQGSDGVDALLCRQPSAWYLLTGHDPRVKAHLRDDPQVVGEGKTE